MIYLISFIILLVAVYFFGWVSFPEKINPDEFQEPPDEDSLMQDAAPFYWEGTSRRAYLLVHGYESTPYSLRGLGEKLHAMGHTVIAPLLPGHGTNFTELSKTRYEHWYEAIRRVYVRERPRFDEFFMVGFSLGGNISLRVALQYRRDLPPSAMVLISAPVVLNGFLNSSLVIRDWRLIFSGIARYFLPPVLKRRDLVATDILNPTVGYSEAYSIPPLHSFRVNAPKIKKYLKYITMPACLIHATNDSTIDVENFFYILRKISSSEKRGYLFRIDDNVSSRHELLTHGQIRDKVIHYIFSFLEDYDTGFKYNEELIPDKYRKKRWFSS